MLRINMMSVYVKDQDRALHFYTEVLGFCKKVDARQIPMVDRGFVGSPRRYGPS